MKACEDCGVRINQFISDMGGANTGLWTCAGIKSTKYVQQLSANPNILISKPFFLNKHKKYICLNHEINMCRCSCH